MRADPYIPAEPHRSGAHAFPVRGVEVMVEGGDHHLMPDQAAVADFDAALILKTAPRIDEHSPAHCDIFAEIGVKGREKSKPFAGFPAGQLRKQGAQLLLRMKSAVDDRRDALCLAAARCISKCISLPAAIYSLCPALRLNSSVSISFLRAVYVIIDSTANVCQI